MTLNLASAWRFRLTLVFSIIALIGLLVTWNIAEAATPTLTAQSGNIAVGGLVSIPIILSEAPNGVSGFDIIVSLSNASVGAIIDADISSMGLAQFTQISSSKVQLKAVDLGGAVESGASNIVLATLTLQGIKRGATDIQISVNILDDDSGYSIMADIVNGALTVKKASGGGGGKSGGDKGDKGGNGKGGGRGKK